MSSKIRGFIKFSILLLCTILLRSCIEKHAKRQKNTIKSPTNIIAEQIDVEIDSVIIDSSMTMEEALSGTKAPKSIIDDLVLLNVKYKSTDNQLHQGQIIVNKEIEKETVHMFDFMLKNSFIIEKAIPIVAYGWSDSLSMDDNNSSGFNYRNISYSRHATGMAIDINPRLNPLRWKNSNKPNQPEGAELDTTINGTLHPEHIVVKEFRKLGFRWGHTFSKYYDDHHFEMNK